MEIRFCTKRDINGNRKILILDDTLKTYSTIENSFFCRSDYIEVSSRDYKKLRQLIQDSNYSIK